MKNLKLISEFIGCTNIITEKIKRTYTQLMFPLFYEQTENFQCWNIEDDFLELTDKNINLLISKSSEEIIINKSPILDLKEVEKILRVNDDDGEEFVVFIKPAHWPSMALNSKVFDLFFHKPLNKQRYKERGRSSIEKALDILVESSSENSWTSEFRYLEKGRVLIEYFSTFQDYFELRNKLIHNEFGSLLWEGDQEGEDTLVKKDILQLINKIVSLTNEISIIMHYGEDEEYKIIPGEDSVGVSNEFEFLKERINIISEELQS